MFEIADAVEAAVNELDIEGEVSLLRLKDGPPTERPINIKVRGSDFEELLAATKAVRGIMGATAGVIDISSDYQPGKPELLLRHNAEAVKRAGVDPRVAARSLMAVIDGEIVTTYQHQGTWHDPTTKNPVELTNTGFVARVLAGGNVTERDRGSGRYGCSGRYCYRGFFSQ